ncbi:MAG: ATP-binding protein [Bacillota bacterium]|nr:ATP-binding protein [Bacillota bacterium]
MKVSLDSILAEYIAKRRRAGLELQKRIDHAFSLYPRLAVLMREKESLLRSLPLAAARDEDDAVILSRIEELKSDILHELKAHGLPDDYLNEKYDCKVCNDTGYVEAGGLKKRCRCLINRLIEVSYGDEPPDHFSHSFDNFDLSIFPEFSKTDGFMQRNYMSDIKAKLQEFSDNFPKNSRPGLLLYGQTGLGKTYLLNCVRKRVLEKGYSVLRLTSFQLINELRDIHVSGTRYLNDFLSPDLLVVDDLGTEPFYNNITREYLFTILNERMQLIKHFAFATNLDKDGLQKRYGERVLSRLFNAQYVSAYPLIGDDLRIQY